MNSSVTEGLNTVEYPYFDDFLTIISKNGQEMYVHMFNDLKKIRNAALRSHVGGLNAPHLQLVLLALRDGRTVCQQGNFEVPYWWQLSTWEQIRPPCLFLLVFFANGTQF